MFNPVIDIDRRIEDLQRLKSNYSNQQQPINIYNGSMPVNDFKAQYINENDKVEDLLVNTKTCFICLKNGYIAIKDLNGDITKYDIVIPLTPEQERIKELENELNEYKQLINATTEKSKSYSNDNEYDEPTTKRVGKSISK